MRGSDATWVGFLAACFVVLGLAGVFATYAVPLPYERALARLGAAAGTDAASALRDAMTEAQGIAVRIRFLLGILTVMCALFGAVIVRVAQRRPEAPAP